jgi:hypothetical protein
MTIDDMGLDGEKVHAPSNCQAVMPALVTKSRLYPTCGLSKCGNRASPTSDGIRV